MKDMIMKTDRLILRKMRRDDAENLLEIFSDPIAMEYYPSTKNEKQTLQWIDRMLENYEKHGTGLWVAEHKQTGEFLGQCGIVPQEVEGSNEWKSAICLNRASGKTAMQPKQHQHANNMDLSHFI